MFRLPSLRRSGQAVWFSQVLLRCKTPLDIAGILFWWSCSWSSLNTELRPSSRVAGTFTPKRSRSNVRSAGRASVSPGLWPSTRRYTCRWRNWSPTRSNNPAAPAGEWLDGRGHWKNKDQRQLQSQYNFFLLSFFISAAGGGAPRCHWEHFLQEETFLSLAQRIAARPALALSA